MAKFCTKCGKPLADGEICSCSAPLNPEASQGGNKAPASNAFAAVGGIWEKFKNQIGLGDPLTNAGDAYEKGKKIVPDCVKPNDGEVPVRQYQIATLRNRILGITYAKAIGRIQVTNKRIVFRAPGRCLVGRTTLQHEFAIDEISGIESRREYVFNFWDMLMGIIAVALGGVAGSAIIGKLMTEVQSTFLIFLIALIFGLGAGALFFFVKKKWLLKLLGWGFATVPLLVYGKMFGDFSEKFLGGLMLFLGIIGAIATLFTLFVHAIRPNLALIIKAKGAAEAIDIRRKKVPFLGLGGAQAEKDDHTGYTDIWPDAYAEVSIREMGALINDIQKLGDFGIDKWKQ